MNCMDREKRLQQLQMNELLESMFPSGPPLDQSYFVEDSWSLRKFCLLAHRLRPEDIDVSRDEWNEYELDRLDEARKFYQKFREHIKEIAREEAILDLSSGLHMRPWKYMKWCARKRFRLPTLAIRSFPLPFSEQYLAFLDPLVSKPKNSRDFHEALYLEHAAAIRQKYPTYSYPEIYEHPHMKRILQDINSSRKKPYARRTILTAWLPKLGGKRPRGRPHKFAEIG